jgi:hypothetical protein
VVVAKITHMQGVEMNVIEDLNECYSWNAAGYLGYLGVGYFYGYGKLWSEN